MKKKVTKRTATPARTSNAAKKRPSWAALIGAFSEALEWSLDRAAEFARHYPDEIETIERVRTYLRARVANKRAPIELDDLLFTFTIVIAALESDLNRLGAFGSWIETETIHVPHATDLERQWMEQVLFTYRALQSRGRAAAAA